MARADASGSSGSSTTWPAVTLDASTPAAAITRPRWFSTIEVGPRRATTRTVSSRIACSRSPTRTRPSALLTTLLVTSTMSPSWRSSRATTAGEVGARVHLADAVDRPGLQPCHRTLIGRGRGPRPPCRPSRRGRSSRAAPRAQRSPVAVIRSTERRVGACRRASRRGRRRAPGRRSARRPRPRRPPRRSRSSSCRAIPRTWSCADDPGDADDRGRRLGDRVAHAGNAEDRAHGDDRVGRRHDHDVGLGDGLERRRDRAWRPRCRSARPRGRGRRPGGGSSTPGSARPCARRTPGRR